MADPKDRLVELRAERARLVDEREKARAEATNDLIAGKKPANTAAALAERIDTPIKARHSISLTDAEGRVAESLNLELLRLKAQSPQRGIAAQAKRELEEQGR